MDGQDEWRYFTKEDIDSQNQWEEKCDTWEKAFVKSKRRKVWAFHAKAASPLCACEIRLFDSEKDAIEYMKQLKSSEIGKLFSITDRWSNIEELTIYRSHNSIESKEEK